MRFGIRTQEMVAVTALTFVIVLTATIIHLAQLSRVVVQEASRQADLVTKQIYAQASRALSRAAGRDPLDALKFDRDLRSLLDASVGYSPDLLFALIADRSGQVVLHTERDKEGTPLPDYPHLDELVALNPFSRFAALYTGGRTYEAVLPLLLNRVPFGSIRLGMSSTLVSQELTAAVKQSLILAALALPLAWIAAMLLARRILRPIRVLSSEVDRLRRGDFEAAAPIAGPDEFQELSSQLQRLGRELQADRIATLSERAPLQHVVDQLEDGIIFLNPDRRVLFFNRAAEGAVGRPLERAVGTPLEEMLDPAHPLRPLIAAAPGAGPRNVTVVLNHDGQPKEFLVSVFAVRDATSVLGTVALLKDLGSVKAVQSLVSYSAKLAALGRLTSGVAHEVKNPLNAMMIHLELLRERLGSAPQEVQHSLEVIGSEIRRLDRVVLGFLRFMRPQELSFKPIDLNALLGSVAALLEPEWQPRGVRFAWALDTGLPAINADEELLRQALLNILQNACQAMPNGGTVMVRTEREGRDLVRISIRDEGVGIATEDLEKIFKLYYTTKADGSGIGLSLVYRIVQMHDGAVEVHSEVGHGTTMVVRLPLR